ncbi:hypothetical protein AB6A40_003270 [Gnathostoma spinigerum]|uniref:N-acetyltransferase domain-containing protein n=1 Tax=Gnathostoma spinigerum TaxID=75299 RepID=A0ABD6EBK5_9BILA
MEVDEVASLCSASKYTDYSLVPLIERPDLWTTAVAILNQEWPRSVTAREHSLQKSNRKEPPLSLALVATQFNCMVGYVCLCPLINNKTGCWIESVVIWKELRGRGIGRILMEKIEECAREFEFKTRKKIFRMKAESAHMLLGINKTEERSIERRTHIFFVKIDILDFLPFCLFQFFFFLEVILFQDCTMVFRCHAITSEVLQVFLSTHDKRCFYEKCGYHICGPVLNVGASTQLFSRSSFSRLLNSQKSDKSPTSQRSSQASARSSSQASSPSIKRLTCVHGIEFENCSKCDLPPSISPALPPPPVLTSPLALPPPSKNKIYMCKSIV